MSVERKRRLDEGKWSNFYLENLVEDNRRIYYGKYNNRKLGMRYTK